MLEFGVADGQGGAFINIEDANAIAKVDLVNRKRTGTIALPGCEGPTGLALVAHGTRLITACANKLALVLDAASGAVVARLPIGRNPDAVLADEARGLAFIPCGGSGTLIELATGDPHHIRVLLETGSRRMSPVKSAICAVVRPAPSVSVAATLGVPTDARLTPIGRAPDVRAGGPARHARAAVGGRPRCASGLSPAAHGQ